MDRRTFLSWMGFGSAVSSLPAVAASLDTKDVKQSVPAKETVEFQEVGTLSELQKPTDAIFAKIDGNKIAVVKDPLNAKNIAAVSRTRTHLGCTVRWKGAEFTCPCHGSAFDFNGTVSRGVAKKPLPRYQVKVEGQKILVGIKPIDTERS